MRVFLLERVRRNIDVSSASEFGQMQYLLEPNQPRARLFDSNEYVTDVVEAFERVGFDPKEDAFVVAGNMVSISLAMIALSLHVKHRGMKLLVFNAMNEGYQLVQIHTDDEVEREVEVESVA